MVLISYITLILSYTQNFYNRQFDARSKIYHKVISFSGRTDNMKKLGDTLKTLIDLERRVYKIDDDNNMDTFEDWLRKSRAWYYWWLQRIRAKVSKGKE